MLDSIRFFLFIYFYLYSINQCFASLCLRPMIVYIYLYKSLNFVKYNHYKNTFLENMRNLFNSSPHFVTLLAQNNTMLFCSAVVFSLFLSSSLDFYENIFIVVCLFFLLQFFSYIKYACVCICIFKMLSIHSP